MVMTKVAHPSVEQRRAKGKDARESSPLAGHSGWVPANDRPDPVELLEAQNVTREPDLVPVRHGRMMVSPFTFYRGAAKIMATDLKDTPTAGLDVQLCGDAHLSNFGGFASPERTLLFDLNDFDETLPGPFEYDVKRMAASFTIAARNNGFTSADTSSGHARLGEGLPRGDVRVLPDGQHGDLVRPNDRARGHGSSEFHDQGRQDEAGGRPSQEGGDECPEERGQDAHPRQPAGPGEARRGGRRSVSDREPTPRGDPGARPQAMYGYSGDEIEEMVRKQFRAYRATLQEDRRHLLERFEIVDVARKVVGVGSVGTRAFIVLLQGRDEQDPLFLQVKEATASVLEGHLRKSRFREPGERVVQGQRLMQAASDIYLGWTKGVEVNRHLYWRQLRDMKGWPSSRR